jgi:GT2 family glycosyltransferase
MSAALADHDVVGARVDHTTLNPTVPRAKWHWQSDGLMDGLGFLPCVGAGTMGVRRVTFEALGGFDATLRCGEDLDFCWRAQLAGYDLAFAGDAVLRYAYRAGLRNHFLQEMRWGRNDVVLYRRYRSMGMPGRERSAVARDWARVAARTLKARRVVELSAAAGMLGRRLGRLSGSVRERTLYL